MTSTPESVPVGTRLETYGLQANAQRGDLRLAPGETFVLTGADEDLKSHCVRIRPESAHDLKRWLGVPDDARRTSSSARENVTGSPARLPCEIFTPHPPLDRADPQMQASLHNFLFGDTRGIVKDHLIALNNYIDRANMALSLFLFDDIYVARHARLIVDPKVHILFARYITVERTGVIEMQAPFGKIDCAGFATTPLGTTSTKAVTARTVTP